MQIENENFPSWLSVALGYGGDSMIPHTTEKAYRQYYLSVDVDLNKIKTKNKTVNAVLHTFGFLKFPAPTFEFSKGNISFHPIYY